MSSGPYSLTLLVDKTNKILVDKAKEFGDQLLKASRTIDRRRIGLVKVLDPREPPSISDLAIHWETPHGSWLPWSRISIFRLNPDIWTEEWTSLKGQFDLVLEDLDAVPIMNSILEIQKDPLPKHMPPLLNTPDCPSISIVTLVHNRPKFVQNACFNLLTTDYPKEKIEWVVVDDSEPDQSASDRIIHFQQAFPGKVTYIPLVKKTNVGKKRNLGVSRAAHDIVMMMDDDDHYPVTSFRRRVAWLTKDRVPHSCAVCTTIAMYDLLNGKSAVNSPPFNLRLSKRCSEATLTFFKNFWRSRAFPENDIAEGEGFLVGRESEVVEMPPQQIIVAFSHGTNISSRKLPAEAGQGCFWGFEPSFLKFIHGLVGVSVEQDS
jgi:hypothetical protein